MPPPTSPPGSISEVGDRDAEQLALAMSAEGGLVATRRARGCRAFVGMEDGAVAAYAWLSSTREWIGEVALELRFGAGEAYIWNCVTLPRYRRRGWFKALVSHLIDLGGREGLRRMWIASAGGAESALADCGFTPAVSVRSRRLAAINRLEVRPRSEREDLVAAAMTALGFRRAHRLAPHRRRAH